MQNPDNQGQIYVQIFADGPSEIDIFDTGLGFAFIRLLFLDSAPH